MIVLGIITSIILVSILAAGIVIETSSAVSTALIYVIIHIYVPVCLEFKA